MMQVLNSNTELSGTNQEEQLNPGHLFRSRITPANWMYRWSVHQGPSPEPLAFGQMGYIELVRQLVGLQKLQRQHRENLAAVSLDLAAQRLLSALDRETSIRWEDLPDRTDAEWSDATRAAALLAGANLCEASPTRFRLNEYGDRLLAESSLADEATAEVAG